MYWATQISVFSGNQRALESSIDKDCLSLKKTHWVFVVCVCESCAYSCHHIAYVDHIDHIANDTYRQTCTL